MSYDPNVPKAPPPRDRGNRALYFIVGGLVVLAAVFVFIFTNNDAGTGMQDPAAPAATTEPATPAPAPAPVPAPAPEGGTTTNQ
jgi:hypothetical protein